MCIAQVKEPKFHWLTSLSCWVSVPVIVGGDEPFRYVYDRWSHLILCVYSVHVSGETLLVTERQQKNVTFSLRHMRWYYKSLVFAHIEIRVRNVSFLNVANQTTSCVPLRSTGGSLQKSLSQQTSLLGPLICRRLGGKAIPGACVKHLRNNASLSSPSRSWVTLIQASKQP